MLLTCCVNLTQKPEQQAGFTLIELSIVLVIIGLIVGGVLVGRDLINASYVRAQITQIEKFNAAVNTFHGKYNAIPGDMSVNIATQFGFTVGANCTGQQGGRDGNGLIDGWQSPYTFDQGRGETVLFWEDLTSSAVGTPLIEGQYPNSGAAFAGYNGLTLASTTMGEYFPAAKIGSGNFIFVYETNGSNWYSVSAPATVASNGWATGTVNIPVIQAYNIDKKVDDGLATTGTVQATYTLGASGVLMAQPPRLIMHPHVTTRHPMPTALATAAAQALTARCRSNSSD